MDGSGPIFFCSIRSTLRVALTAAALARAALPPSTAGEAVVIAIDRMTIGSPPAGFSFARTGQGAQGEWSVVADPTAKAGRAIEQQSADRTDYRFPLAIHENFSAKDLIMQVRFKPVAGRIDQAGGVVVRLVDPDNYYVARANALENNVRFYRVVAGRRQQLGTSNNRVTSNEWHVLTLRAEGNRFTVSYDGAVLFEVKDSTFKDAGGVALWTKADSVTRFDQVTITALP
ncbi:hypothetical protein V1290_000821 [Bradyrhizobium sp. AZCC 1578]